MWLSVVDLAGVVVYFDLLLVLQDLQVVGIKQHHSLRGGKAAPEENMEVFKKRSDASSYHHG